MEATHLSLADLEAFDPHHRRTGGDSTRVCCPLCGNGKKIDTTHRCLCYSEKSGVWCCYRCGATGVLKEFWTDRSAPERSSYSKRGGRSSFRDSAAAVRNAFSFSAGTTDQSKALSGSAPAASAVPTSAPVLASSAGIVVKPMAETLAACLGDDKLLPATTEPGAAYLAGRGLDAALCNAAGMRFARSFYGRPAVAFAIRNEAGKLVALQGRYIDGKDTPRMRTAGDRKRGVFSTPGALDAGVVAVFTEAPLDAVSLHVAGSPAIALCGSNGVPDWLIRRLAFSDGFCKPKVVAAFDADEAGDKAATALADLLEPVGGVVVRLRPTGGKDWNAILKDNGVEALRRQVALVDDLRISRIALRGPSTEAVAADDLSDPFAEEGSDPAPLAPFRLATAYAGHTGYASDGGYLADDRHNEFASEPPFDDSGLEDPFADYPNQGVDEPQVEDYAESEEWEEVR